MLLGACAPVVPPTTASLLSAAANTRPSCAPFAGDRQVLWEEKVGLVQPFAGNAATAWGSSAEPRALAAYEAVTGHHISSCMFQGGLAACGGVMHALEWLAACLPACPPAQLGSQPACPPAPVPVHASPAAPLAPPRPPPCSQARRPHPRLAGRLPRRHHHLTVPRPHERRRRPSRRSGGGRGGSRARPAGGAGARHSGDQVPAQQGAAGAGSTATYRHVVLHAAGTRRLGGWRAAAGCRRDSWVFFFLAGQRVSHTRPHSVASAPLQPPTPPTHLTHPTPRRSRACCTFLTASGATCTSGPRHAAPRVRPGGRGAGRGQGSPPDHLAPAPNRARASLDLTPSQPALHTSAPRTLPGGTCSVPHPPGPRILGPPVGRAGRLLVEPWCACGACTAVPPHAVRIAPRRPAHMCVCMAAGHPPSFGRPPAPACSRARAPRVPGRALGGGRAVQVGRWDGGSAGRARRMGQANGCACQRLPVLRRRRRCLCSACRPPAVVAETEELREWSKRMARAAPATFFRPQPDQ